MTRRVLAAKALLGTLDRQRAVRLGPCASLLAVGVASLICALIASRFAGPGGPWLWNNDMLYINYPLAAFFPGTGAGRPALVERRHRAGIPLYAGDRWEPSTRRTGSSSSCLRSRRST